MGSSNWDKYADKATDAAKATDKFMGKNEGIGRILFPWAYKARDVSHHIVDSYNEIQAEKRRKRMRKILFWLFFLIIIGCGIYFIFFTNLGTELLKRFFHK